MRRGAASAAEARDVDDVVVGATGGVVEGDGDVVANAVASLRRPSSGSRPARSTSRPAPRTRSSPWATVSSPITGMVSLGETVVRKAAVWSKGVAKAVHRVSPRRWPRTTSSTTTAVRARRAFSPQMSVAAVRRPSWPRSPFFRRPVSTLASRCRRMPSRIWWMPPPPSKYQWRRCCHHHSADGADGNMRSLDEVSVDCDVVLKCCHVHMACLHENSVHCGHAPTRRSFQVPCANCCVSDRWPKARALILDPRRYWLQARRRSAPS